MEVCEKLKLIENILKLSDGSLELEMELMDVEEWDSFSILNFIATFSSIDNNINYNIIKNCETISDLCNLI